MEERNSTMSPLSKSFIPEDLAPDGRGESVPVLTSFPTGPVQRGRVFEYDDNTEDELQNGSFTEPEDEVPITNGYFGGSQKSESNTNRAAKAVKTLGERSETVSPDPVNAMTEENGRAPTLVLGPTRRSTRSARKNSA